VFLSQGDNTKMADLKMLAIEEAERRKTWRKENIRRRHNYLPFIVEMLKALGDQGKLLPIYEKAKEKAVELEKKKKEKDEKSQKPAT